MFSGGRHFYKAYGILRAEGGRRPTHPHFVSIKLLLSCEFSVKTTILGFTHSAFSTWDQVVCLWVKSEDKSE